MPQTKAAAKALRTSQRRRVTNDRWRRKMRESIKEVRTAVVAGEKSTAETALKTAQKLIDRAARHNILHPRTAARKKSRLQRAIAKIKAA